MSINLSVPSNNDTPDLKPKITVIGVGGAGGNAVNNMIDSELQGVDFLVVNTDAQALAQSRADRRVQLGANVTGGLGAGSRPEIGRAAAEESIEDIVEQINGSHMVFIAAGMGGGTGTGAGPVIARASREQGILTISVVTKPFQFEGGQRMKVAEAGVVEMAQYVDTMIVIPNQNLFRVANEKTTFAEAFAMADQVLYSGVRGVTDLMVMPGLINLDFADIRSVMSGMGKAMMGTGEGEGERRALDAAESAISNPLLDDTTMKGAKRVLINITGGPDMTLFEADEAANRIRSEIDAEAHAIFGSTFDDGMEGRIRVSVVATGMDSDASALPKPTLLSIDDPAEGPPAGAPSEDGPATVVEIRPPAEVPEPAAEKAEPPAAEAEKHESDPPSQSAPAQMAAAAEAVEEPAAAEAELAPPPPATPALGATDVFIPPQPATPAAGGVSKEADPFAAAAMINGPEKPKIKPEEKPVAKKRLSLFERVTGTGRAAKRAKPAEGSPAEPPRNEADTGVLTAEPAVSEAPNEVMDEQKRLGGLDPTERISNNRIEEDLLDIPAFLRRQAN